MNNSPGAVPKVSVAMITYNHERFIAQAIESVLMQETDFPVELVLGEDCSTDGTRNIVKAYAEKHPTVIRALLPEHNLGAQRNFTAVLTACRGEYVACLEGDDYWTDPAKLKKQVALLDQNPGYSLCGTACRNVIVLPDGREQDDGLHGAGRPSRLYHLAEVLDDYPFRTLTFVYRNRLLELPEWFQRSPYGDICLLVLLAEKGPIAFMNEVTGTYRMHPGGMSSGSSASDTNRALQGTLDLLNEHLGGRYFNKLRRCGLERQLAVCLKAVDKGRGWEARQIYWGSWRRFAPHLPVAFLTCGVLIYFNKYGRALIPPGLRRVIRTGLRKLLP